MVTSWVLCQKIIRKSSSVTLSFLWIGPYNKFLNSLLIMSVYGPIIKEIKKRKRWPGRKVSPFTGSGISHCLWMGATRETFGQSTSFFFYSLDDGPILSLSLFCILLAHHKRIKKIRKLSWAALHNFFVLPDPELIEKTR